LAGVVALVSLTAHGALYVVLKTEAELAERSRQVAVGLWPVELTLTLVSLAATYYVRPQVMNNYRDHPIALLVPLVVFAGLVLMIWGSGKGSPVKKQKLAFLGSGLYLAAMLVGAVFALYPVVLPASTDPAYSLTIDSTAAGHHGLVVGVMWWLIGIVITLGYFVFVYRMFRGKVGLEGGGY
jgi:cytochrome d ubiquinol oxidase subunit II